ncbi:MAG: hypothetical protein U9R79_07590 [Armatimonadota bacterium]|nr:hypothetical protein [Armatimonadota bacterium]
MSPPTLRRLAATGLGLTMLLVLTWPAVAQRVEMDVLANISPDLELYFEGTVAASNLTPQGHLQVHNELDITVEFIEKGGKFKVLPDSYKATSDEAFRGRRTLGDEEKNGVNSQTVRICGQEVVPQDEGQPFGIRGTTSLGNAHRFRIIATLKHHWFGNFPAADCIYDVAGPFAVTPGVARKRQGGGLLSQVGRFLQRSVCDIGEQVVEGGVGALLGGGAVGLLQSALLDEVQSKQGALGQALSYIGAGHEGGSATGVLPAAGSEGDLARSVVQRLLGEQLGEAAGGLLSPTGEIRLDAPQIQQVVQRITSDVQSQLGLRDLSVSVDEAEVIVRSLSPALQGHGHLEPIVAYLLAEAAVSAPWVQTVTVFFDDLQGGSLGVLAPADIARQYAQGSMDTAAFLSQCGLTDESSAQTQVGDVAGQGQPVGAAAGGTQQSPATTQALIRQAQLPAGWLASATRPIPPPQLQGSLPGLDISAHQVVWAGLQVLQVGSSPVTLLGMELQGPVEATALLRDLATQTGGQGTPSGLVAMPTNPTLYAVQIGRMVHLMTGEEAPVTQVAGVVAQMPQQAAAPAVAAFTPHPGEGTAAPAGAQPGAVTATGQPQPPTPGPAQGGEQQPPEPVVGLPEAMPLQQGSFIQEAVLCTDVDRSGTPVEITEPLPTDTTRVGVFLDIQQAPANSQVLLEWFREGRTISRRLITVSGSKRTVNWVMPSAGGFSPGSYWLEITADDTLVARLPFTVQ